MRSITMVALIGLALSAASGCGSEPGLSSSPQHTAQPLRTYESDYPTYGSVTELADIADVEVVVKVGKLISSEFDDGGTGNPEASVPMAFWQVDIQNVLGGTVTANSIVLAWPDVTKGNFPDRSTLQPGAELVLFVSHVSASEAPGIRTQSEFYVPLGGDNGVLDLTSTGQVTARSTALTSLTPVDSSKEAELVH